MRVTVRRGQKIDDALRVFTSKCKKEGVIEEYKKRMSFEKRSDKKRRERSRRLKKIKRSQQMPPQ
ncbi:30S ribosomal protein S21 [PVC group bacterium]|nr:30S ribosomal protein S21 [PVC group bacterium]